MSFRFAVQVFSGRPDFFMLQLLPMSDKLFIPIILGTAREGRQSEKVAKFVLAETKKHPNITTELLDVRDFRPPATDRKSVV